MSSEAEGLHANIGVPEAEHQGGLSRQPMAPS